MRGLALIGFLLVAAITTGPLLIWPNLVAELWDGLNTDTTAAPAPKESLTNLSPSEAAVATATTTETCLDRNITIPSQFEGCTDTCCWQRVDAPQLFNGERGRAPEVHERISIIDLKNLAEVVYGTLGKPAVFSVPLMTPDMLPCLQPGTLLYVEALFLVEFMEHYYPKLPHPIVLITGDSDHPATPQDFADALNGKVLHWFGDNVNTYRSFSNFTALPIGLSQWFSQREAMHDLMTLQGEALDAFLQTPEACNQTGRCTAPKLHDALLGTGAAATYAGDTRLDSGALATDTLASVAQLKGRGHPRRDTLLLAFNPKSRPPERQPAWDMGCTAGGPWANFSTCTGHTGSWDTAQFYREMRRFRFLVSPHGAGLDSYRTWEALLAGIIPIVKSSPLDPLYRSLPVLVVRRWEEVTEELLTTTWDMFTEKMRWDYSPLYTGYWQRLFHDRRKEFMEGRVDVRWHYSLNR